MSKDDLGSNEDFDSEQDRGDQFTPEQTSGSFDALLEDLNEKMVAGRLANRLRGVFSRAGRPDAEFSQPDEGALADSEPASEDVAADVLALDNEQVRAKSDDKSDKMREFISSLDERFPRVRSPKMPPPPEPEDEAAVAAGQGQMTADFLNHLGKQKKRFSDVDNEGAAQHQDVSSDPDSSANPSSPANETQTVAHADDEQKRDRAVDEPQTTSSSQQTEGNSDIATADGDEQATATRSLADETKRITNVSKSFIKAQAAKIATAAAAREDARRAKTEAKRLEELAKAEEGELPAPVETGWGDLSDESDFSSGRADSAPIPSESSDDEGQAPSAKKEESVRERSSTSIPKATPTGAPVRMAGDTDSLKAVDSDLPKKISFTRRGSSIMKLPSGTRVIQNSMRSVRSTVDALNEGQSIDPTRPTIALFAALMVAATIVSLTTMAGTHTFSSSIFNIDPKPTEVVEATEEAPSEAPTPPPAGAPKIASIDVISYNNDDGDHPEWAQYLFDGDQSTRWQTRYFAQPELPEDNRIRLVIHLAEESSVKSVSFQGPIDGGQVDLRVNDGSDPFATPVLTSSKMAKTTTLTPSEPAVGTTVTLDFVALPTDDEGQFRAKIDELTLN
ncbi:hypothetical protein [Actinomyces sp. S4-C9]|uniref:hypothetical protein n=2 Tax=unclassified Actinomyces TaxID=2609248 RepID=UPI00050F0EBA|nr:hypothetical protein [Actinomyces sp. S4-C9]KGF00963.1 hypothetical protein HMPREF1628_07105 [Actinomyces sp. S4-C9]